MIYSESIVLFSCVYLSLTYSIFYLFFEAYPIIFQGMQAALSKLILILIRTGIYSFSTGQCGLTFIPSTSTPINQTSTANKPQSESALSYPHRLPRLRLRLPTRPIPSQTLGENRRIPPSPPHLPRRAPIHHLPLLARLVRPVIHPLDYPHALRHPLRHWLPAHLHGAN